LYFVQSPYVTKKVVGCLCAFSCAAQCVCVCVVVCIVISSNVVCL
jgi:hypothetical protein